MAKAQTNPKKAGPGSPARFKGRPRGRQPFRQRDVARAIRAAQATGGCSGVEIAPGGAIRIVLGGAQAPSSDSNPWDEVQTDAEDAKRPT
jgi:hypothetical protein